MSENTDIEKRKFTFNELKMIVLGLAFLLTNWYITKEQSQATFQATINELRALIAELKTGKEVQGVRLAFVEAVVTDLTKDCRNYENRIASLEAILPQQPTFTPRK